jgi:hypothetical protein
MPMPTMLPPPMHALLAVVVVHAQPASGLSSRKGAAAVEQARHALARQQLAALLELVALGRRFRHAPWLLQRLHLGQPLGHALRGWRRRPPSACRGASEGRHQRPSAPRGVTAREAVEGPSAKAWSSGKTSLPSEAAPSICSVTPVMKAAPARAGRRWRR